MASAGVAEANPDVTTDAVLAGLKTDPDFSGSLLSLATQLAGLNGNPWIKSVNIDAHGYAVVNLTPAGMTCTFRQVNKLVAGGAAPATPGLRATRRCRSRPASKPSQSADRFDGDHIGCIRSATDCQWKSKYAEALV